MSIEKGKTPVPKTPVTVKVPAPAAGPSGTTPGTTARIPSLFRKTDWLTLLITFGAVWIGYYLTLAPELTLEDSGELATGSFYAGIPHPPGYPVWTIYTWLWTVLIPFKNVAFRVALGEATGGALAAGLLGMLVSRGSSLLMEGIEELKAMSGRWESAICMVSGFVAGGLLGFNGYMWSQSVIVEVYAFSVASFMVTLLCLLRWIHAPSQWRYLYFAMFFHGICFTNHQTLIVAAMGIEVAIAAANYRMGRYLFLGNSIIYLCGLLLKQAHILTALEQNPAIFIIFNVVGLCSVGAYFWFTLLSRETFPEFCLDGCLAAFCVLVAAVPGNGNFFVVVALLALGGVGYFAWQTRKLGLEWLVVIASGFCWIMGAMFYFYMPLAGMSNPPMEWGYPRTVEGFIHAFTRGQYEKTNPTPIFQDPVRFLIQLRMLGRGIISEFNWVYAFLALVPLAFFRRLHRRERAWLIGITAIYLCLGVLLLILLNPPPDRAAQDLNRVFFTASHTCIAMLVGYGLTLVAAYMATHYERFRPLGIIGAAIAVGLSLFTFTQVTSEVFFGDGASVSFGDLMSLVGRVFSNKDQYGLPVFGGLILIGMTVAYLAGLLIYRKRAPLALTIGLFALMPLHSVMTHWSDNEQRNHWFGYWFGHDMFTPPFKAADGKPFYPPMTKDAILFGGTDPGRFCPTYMIFCESFTPHKNQPDEDQKFDRRDVYIITQNALADGTYLNYIRAQYNRSTQIDPPFFQELFRSERERTENYITNTLGRAVIPLDNTFIGLGDRIEKERRDGTSWFKEDQFLDLASFSARLRGQQDTLSKFIFESLTPETQKLLSGSDQKALRKNLATDLNRLLDRELATKTKMQELRKESAELEQKDSDSARKRLAEVNAKMAELAKVPSLYDANRFKDVKLSEYVQDFIKENPMLHSRVRLNRLLLEEAYPKEIAKTIGGVYPDREIYTPTPEDSSRCFQEYLTDAQKRLQLNQLKPGEDVHIIDNRVQVSGQVAVMAINGLLTKVIFDHNPKNEFFVEESFPLDWMYPYLTPFSVIMKINRNPLPELSEEIVRRDHEFWKTYSKRLTGDIIDYDTPVKKIADFIEKTYLHRDFSGFTGDRKFVRDDQAQKAFSKLRSSIGGIYAWRITDPRNHDPATQQRMIREADFAFKQAFAFCPYSPEAVFRYVNLLLSLQKFDDALIIASTCQKLDPNNAQVIDLVNRLQTFRKGSAEANPPANTIQQAEKTYQADPNNFQNAFNLAGAYLQMGQTNRALEILDRVMNNPKAGSQALRALVPAYSSINNTAGLQTLAGHLNSLWQTNSSNFEAAVGLAEVSHTLQQNDRATQVLDQVLANPHADANAVLMVAQQYSAMVDFPKIETALAKLVTLVPESPEAWYDLAGIRASLGKTSESTSNLIKALDLTAKRPQNSPKGRDLVAESQKEPRFAAVRQSPEYQKAIQRK